MTDETAVLIVNQQAQVLARRDGHAAMLPRVQVEGGRVGISLSRAIREQLQLEIFILVFCGSAEESIPVLRLQNETSLLPSGYFWIEPSEVSAREDKTRLLGMR